MTDAAKPHGCHNRQPYRASTVMQDGWILPIAFAGQTSRLPRIVSVPFRMQPACQYTLSDLGQVDNRCAGCRWRANQGESK